MIFHFALLFWSVIFLIGLEIVALNPLFISWQWYLFSIGSLVIVSLLASRRLTGRISDAFVPILLSFASPTLLSLIDHSSERQVFIVLSACMYYSALLGNYRLHHAPTDKTAEAFLNSSAMAAMFFFYAGLYGFYLNFSFPLWGLMILYFLGTTLTSYETFITVDKKERKRVMLYSALLGLIMGEMAWVVSLWPFGYLTTGALCVILFFLVWDIAFDAFRETLSLRKALVRILFFLGLIILLLTSSPWRILV
ncbi:MAG: hypothetical protein KBD27_03860 [Candidatus Moranbacteria bacterium]|nr:hypothetical protein [Candidatus Moranbacteria bacterium]